MIKVEPLAKQISLAEVRKERQKQQNLPQFGHFNLKAIGEKYSLVRNKSMRQAGHLGSIRRKHNVRWQHLSLIKEVSFELTLFFFLLLKTERAISGTSAATFKVMEPHCIVWQLFLD